MKRLVIVVGLIACCGCAAGTRTATVQGASRPTRPALYSQAFDASNGIRDEGRNGTHAFGYRATPVLISMDDIGLVGSAEYTIEFYWQAQFPIDGRVYTLLEDVTGASRTMVRAVGLSGYKYRLEVSLDPSVEMDDSGVFSYDVPRWHHVAIAGNYETGTHVLYVDGIRLGRRTNAKSALGWSCHDLALVVANGMVDDVAVYDVDISAQLKPRPEASR